MNLQTSVVTLKCNLSYFWMEAVGTYRSGFSEW